MSQFIETRWTRYGHNRVYMKTQAGDEIGHVDLQSHTIAVSMEGHEATLADCLRRWTSASHLGAAPNTQPTEVRAPGTTPPALVPAPSDTPLGSVPGPPSQPTDLAANVAGQAARAQRDRVNAQAPALNLVARLFGLKTEERSWRVGAKGEEKVARELTKLGPAWHVLHAVEAGDQGSDIDHVVIGPPGVITLNTKRLLRGRAWIGERKLMVNGHKTDYLRNSRYEADRTARLLSAACGRPIPVRAAIVFVDLDDFAIKQMPASVHVTTRRRLVRWLQALPTTTKPAQVEEIFSVARLSTTWRTRS